MNMRKTGVVTRRGAALVEVVVATAVVCVVLAIFMVAGSDSRRSASVSESLNNLKQFAWAGSAYAGDCNERFWTFSWTASDNPTGHPFVDDNAAAAAQAIDIIQRRTNINIQQVSTWIPHILYSHLVLADHLNLKLPMAWSVAPGDDKRASWQRCASEPDPNQCFLTLPPGQRPTDGSSNDLLRWMVSTSYQIGPSFISRDMRGPVELTLQSALTNHYTYTINGSPLGNRLMSQVAFPSRKVMLWDQYQRHFGDRIAYYAYPEARVPLLMADGSAVVRATSESNLGFYPNIPANPNPLAFNYVPRPWEPPTLSGSSVQLMTGYYGWTRGGLAGRDFGAPEACTGQPGCTP